MIFEFLGLESTQISYTDVCKQVSGRLRKVLQYIIVAILQSHFSKICSLHFKTLFIFGCTGYSLLLRPFSSCHVQVSQCDGLLVALQHWALGHVDFSSCGVWVASSVVVAPGLHSTGSIVLVHQLNCSMACKMFPKQRLNLGLLHWQVDS